jgi:glycosyltransferase involved in cell wall biosynthesis
MKIAIVAPSPVPFTIGGAENLFWGLQNYINENTNHQCELIKIPSPESNLEQLINSYQNFSQLNLDHFDCVISTKYPSWMVNHDNHVCYLLHRLRGLYDTYHFSRQSLDVPWDNDEMKLAKKLSLDLGELGHDNLQASFDLCRQFVKENVDPRIVQFPGPFSRWLVHHFDSIGLDPTKIAKYSAISNVVKNRQDYFPSGVPVSVLYPPPRLSGFRCGNDDYLFTVSRLDGPKRIRMLVEAMRYVKSDIPLLIAGTGPDEAEIRQLADGDKRIQFLGFVKDSDLVEYYSNALAIPFIPYDEDYGLITIEAMMSSKPVLTLTDSGGPNEFVRNGITGFSVEPNSKSIAKIIDYLCTHREEARTMGLNAKKMTSEITWEKVVSGLLDFKPANNHNLASAKTATVKKRMVVAVTFPIYPARGGGQSRVYNLYKNLAKKFDIEIHSLCAYGQPALDRYIAPSLREIRTPVSQAHQAAEDTLSKSVGWIPVTDIVMPKLIALTPDYLNRLKTAAQKADIVVACHPYLGKVLHEMAPNTEFWLEAQDVELSIKAEILPNSDEGRQLLELVKVVEGYSWKNAKIVFACTHQDLNQLKGIYGETTAKVMEVPNGAEVDDVPFVNLEERERRKHLLGCDNKTLALFMGSWHGPNIEAAKKIIELARNLPNVVFIIIGSVCDAIVDIPITKNIKLMGVVNDDEKSVLLSVADVALNPMENGSGSNLKVLDYFAAGIALVSTDFGMRGIDANKGVHYISSEINEFFEVINGCQLNQDLDAISNNARELVVSKYSWDIISKNFYKNIECINTKSKKESH